MDGLVSFVIVLAVLGGAAYFYMQHRNKNKKNSENSGTGSGSGNSSNEGTIQDQE